jgi:cell division protein ZapA
MAQVTVTLNGRTYRLRCADGEEERLHDLVDHIRNKLDDLTARFGQIGSERLLLMAAILISDELFDARDRGGVDKGEAA